MPKPHDDLGKAVPVSDEAVEEALARGREGMEGVDIADEHPTSEQHLVDEEVEDSVTEVEVPGEADPNIAALFDNLDRDLMNRNLTNQSPSPEVAAGMEEVRRVAKMLSNTITTLVPVSPERSQALLFLRQTVMWAVAGQALNHAEAWRRYKNWRMGVDDMVSLDPQGEEPDVDAEGPFPTENDLKNAAWEAMQGKGNPAGGPVYPPGAERPVDKIEVPTDG